MLQNATTNSLISQIAISKISDNEIVTNLMSQIAISKSDHLQSVESLTSQIATLKNGMCAVTKMEVSTEAVLQLLK